MAVTIVNGFVVTLDDARTVHERASITINGGLIRDVGPERGRFVKAEDILDASEGIVLPGFLNAHTHSPENLARGVVDRMPLEDWLTAVWPPLDSLTPDQIRVAILLGCTEMLRTGTTAVVDHFRQTPLTREAVHAAIEAYRESGMRAAVAIMLRDRSMPPWVNGRYEDLDSLCNDILDEYPAKDERVSVMLAPSAPHRCTDKLLALVADASASRGICVHAHVDESRAEREQALEYYGCSSVHHLDALGLLNRRVSLAHCVWVDETDLDLIAARNATIVHNPISNLRLGNGIAPVPDMLRRGIAVALGTDGAASNDGQSMPEVIKAASLLPGASGFSKRPTVADVLSMTTGRVSERFGMAKTGSIAVGQQADLVVYEAADPRLHPRNDIHRQIVLAGPGLTVRHVVIAGQVVMRDGKIQTFEEAEIYSQADRLRTSAFGNYRH